MDDFAFRTLAGHAFADLFLGRHEQAEAKARRALVAAPAYTIAHRALAAALVGLGRTASAREVVADLTARHPGLTLDRYAVEMRFANPEARTILLASLSEAGLRQR